MGELAPWHWVIIAILLVVLFGSAKLPGAARSIGRSMRILKSEVSGLHDDDESASKPAATPTAAAAPAQQSAPTAQTAETSQMREEAARLREQAAALERQANTPQSLNPAGDAIRSQRSV